jgi:orotidine-5'-phosphate decarboxylase
VVARDAGADAVTVVNTIPGLLFEGTGTRLGHGNGGVSGPALLPIGVLAVRRVIERSGGMPVIGVGGVRSADDVRQYLRAGATLVGVGTAALADPPVAELVVALDVESGDAAERLLDRIPGARWVKVGSVIMGREGPSLVRRLAGRGLSVFLDLKWHDIPNTVAGAVSAARDAGVAMATVHALGGAAMMEAAARSAGGVAIVGVTVLTSHDAPGYDRAVGRTGTDLEREVVRLAREAMGAGLAGIVCSPRELPAVRDVAGRGGRLVVPGIRRAGDSAGDQARTATPGEAAALGATHLVVGRPILAAADPGGVFAELSAASGA